MDKTDILIKYLGLDKPWIPECAGDFSLIECRGGDMGGCNLYDLCKKEIEIRDLLKLN